VIGNANFVSMTVEELWEIHEEISKVLEAKLLAEKKILDDRLISLCQPTRHYLKARRPYPPVLPKFANPDAPSQVWAGRGKRPRWVTEKIASGLSLDDLSIGCGSSVAIPEEHMSGAENRRQASHKVRSRG
jgi:DNA-binding protein H-NS